MTIYRHNFGCSKKEREGFVLVKAGKGNPYEFKCEECCKSISIMDSLSLNKEDMDIFLQST